MGKPSQASAERSARAGLFAIAPGAPSLSTFCARLLDGAILPHLIEGGPAALADVTIYVPTRRAGRALHLELARRSATALFLPRIRALGALEPDVGEDDDFDGAEIEAIEAVGALERRLELTQLTLAFARALEGAVLGVDELGRMEVNSAQSPLVGATPADAWSLAGQLADLIDEFAIEGVDPARLEALADHDHSFYWRVTLRFLDIALRHWPERLAERGEIDVVTRRNGLIAREIEAMAQDGPLGARIVFGSTGTNRATQRLMQAVLARPRGAVVLPGLDGACDAAAWRALDDEEAQGHPQAALATLLRRLQRAREDVAFLRPEGLSAPSLRAEFLSQAFAPAAATTRWRDWFAARRDVDPLDGVTLIEAGDEREEALAIAVALREQLENPGKTAALVTPDRAIARRVAAELRRWGVTIDNSGGQPLSGSAAGRWALAALAAAEDLTDGALTNLLGFAQTAPTAPRAATLETARILEQAVLRATTFVGAFEDRLAEARAAATERHAHPFARKLTEADFTRAGALRDGVVAALAPLSQAGSRTLAEWAQAHADALAGLAAHAGRDDHDDGAALDALLAALAQAGGGLRVERFDYAEIFARLAQETAVRGPQAAHARVKILGLLEARLIEVDRIVMAGLDEAVWPPQISTDAFLNRPMRAALGLPAPERRIGQTAHDFVMGCNAPQVFITRARKRGGGPAQPSRFLQRMAALHEPAFGRARSRGDIYLHWARLLDTPRPGKSGGVSRPSPKPPVALRPEQLSVTRIETLRRDPYAIYAERILDLHPVGDLDAAPGAAEIGSAIHAAFQKIVEGHAQGFAAPDARTTARAFLESELAPLLADPVWRAFQWPRILAGLDFMLEYEGGRRPDLRRAWSEIDGRMELPLADGANFVLTARADRIEIARDGAARIVDFKTGTPPSVKQVEAGFAPQMTLQAAMLEQGAFEKIGAAQADLLLYVKIGGKDGGKIQNALGARTDMAALVARHFNETRAMLSSYRDPAHGYPARPFVEFALRYNAYDHLARVQEWAAGAEDEA